MTTVQEIDYDREVEALLAAGFLNSYMASYLIRMRKAGLNEQLWQEAINDAQTASAVGVDSEDDFKTFFYIDHFVEDLVKETFGARLNKGEEEQLKKFMFRLRDEVDYSDLNSFKGAVLKWLENRKKVKSAHPNIGTNYHSMPRYDLDKWQVLAQKILQSIHIGFSREFALKDIADANLENPERLDFMAWFSLLANREGDKFNVGQQIREKNQSISHTKRASNNLVGHLKDEIKMIWDALLGAPKELREMISWLKILFLDLAIIILDFAQDHENDTWTFIWFSSEPEGFSKQHTVLNHNLSQEQFIEELIKRKPQRGIRPFQKLIIAQEHDPESGNFYVYNEHGVVIGFARETFRGGLTCEKEIKRAANEINSHFTSNSSAKSAVLNFLTSLNNILETLTQNKNYRALAEVASILNQAGHSIKSDLVWTEKERKSFEDYDSLRQGSQMNEITKVAIYGDNQFYYVPTYKAPAPSVVEPATPAKDEKDALDFESVRKKMMGRIFSIDKLIEKYRKVMSDDAIDGIEKALNDLKSKVRKMKQAATLNDVLIKTARILESKFEFTEGAEALFAIAADEEPITAEPVPEISGDQKQQQSLTKIIQELYWLSATVKNRGLIRELAKIDLQLHDLNMAGYFTELMDCQAKLIEAFNYVGNKLEDVLPKVQSGLVAGQLAAAQSAEMEKFQPAAQEVKELSKNLRPRKTTPEEHALLEKDKTVEVNSPAPDEQEVLRSLKLPVR